MISRPALDSSSDTPLYRQLYQEYAQMIRSGQLARGERLPATRELAGMLGLNRTTISAAYDLLEKDGLISAQVGRGSFVAGGPPASPAQLDWDSLLDARTFGAMPPIGKDGISFATSRPADDLFPIGEFRATCEEVLRGPNVAHILQLGSPAGYEPLRQYLIRESGAMRAGDDLMITSGCQQGLDLVARVLVRPGDKVAVEDPVYPGVKNLLARAGAMLVGIPVGPAGMDVAQLERAVERERPKLAIVTSDFQNPTGATLPLDARLAILRLARAAGMLVIENDIYGDLRYHGEPLPSLRRLDDSGHTLLLRSFSKIAFPGLRVGWIEGPRAPLARLVEAKQLSDLHTDQLSQAVLLRFAESGRLAAHRRRALEAGTARLAATLAACERYLPPGTTYTRPQGGMNLWVRLPEPLDAGELLQRALREKVAYMPGKYFAVTRAEPGALRLSFAGLAPEEITKGLRILGGILAAELESTGRVEQREPAPAMV